MAIGDLRLKFRQSADYTYPMLIRDLIDYTYELTEILQEAQTPKEWTPSLVFGGNAVGMVYSANRRGKYTRVGKLLQFSGEFTLTAKGSSVGTAYILGLPFSFNSAAPAQCQITYATGMAWTASTTPSLLGYGEGGGPGLVVREMGPVTMVTSTDAQFTNTSRLVFSGMAILP